MIDYNKFGLLPYQVKYIEDTSQVKIVEKSRRIGLTRTQALEDVIECGVLKKYDVWFSSNNDLNGREYIRYCKQFANALNLVIKSYSKQEILKDVKAYSIEFNKFRITAVSSSPEQLHGKGGKIVLDEFARRDNEIDTWEAAAPAALVWGYPIRIISTHNGINSLFNQFVKSCIKKERNWSHHKITIQDAVNQNLVDKVIGKKATQIQKDNFIKELRQNAGSENIWQQQFMCVPQDESSSFMPYSLIQTNTTETTMDIKDLHNIKNPIYIGVDVGRYNDLTVVWLAEKYNNKITTRYVKEFHNTPLPKQREFISSLIKLPHTHRVCIDKTGLGLGLVEELQTLHGTYSVEGVTFTLKTKEEMAFRVRKAFEDNAFKIPNNNKIIEDFHGIKQETTISGNIRLISDGNNQETKSHNDFFWAAALCLEAANSSYSPLNVFTTKQKNINKFKTNLSWNGLKY